MLQIVENLDIYIIRRTVKSKQFAQSVFVIILIGQLKNRLLSLQAQPYYGTAYQLVCPLATSYEPRALYACKMRCCRQVNTYRCITVKLKIRCRNRIRNLFFYRLLYNIGLFVSPSQQIDFAGSQYSAYTHRNRTRRQFIQTQVMRSLGTRSCVYQNQSCGRSCGRSRLVHCYITFTTDSHQRNIQSTVSTNSLFVQ